MLSPAPPYWVGQIGTVQARWAQRSSHSAESASIGTLEPPPATGPGPLALSGQFSSSQLRVANRNSSGEVIIGSDPIYSARTLLTGEKILRVSLTHLNRHTFKV